MDVDSTKHSTLATGVRNRVGEDGAQARRLAARMESSGPMTASEWDWTRRVFDHVQLNASEYTASVRFYETVLAPLGIPKIAEHEQGTWSSDWTDFTTSKHVLISKSSCVARRDSPRPPTSGRDRGYAAVGNNVGGAASIGVQDLAEEHRSFLYPDRAIVANCPRKRSRWRPGPD